MRLTRSNPTIRETNKYLSEIVEVLQMKHGGVSNEDFERDLVAATGIGWKQVKNYRNHPRPGERLKDNAVVLKFVRQARENDTGRKVRRFVTITAVIAAVAATLFWYATTPKKIEAFVVHEVPLEALSTTVVDTRVFLSLPSKSWMFRLGPLEHSQVPLETFVCVDVQGTGTRTCSLREPDLQAALVIDGNIVRRYSITAFRNDDIAKLKSELVTIFGETAARFPTGSKPIEELSLNVGKENVQLMATSPNHNTRPMLSATVSLK